MMIKWRFSEQISFSDHVAYDLNRDGVLRVVLSNGNQETTTYIDLSKLDPENAWYCTDLVQSVELINGIPHLTLVYLLDEGEELDEALTQWHEPKTIEFEIAGPVQELQGQTQGDIREGEPDPRQEFVTRDYMDRQIESALAEMSQTFYEMLGGLGVGNEEE